MSNWDYNSYICTKDKLLIEELKKASFHYDCKRKRKVYNWETGKEEVRICDEGYDAIDLAVLFGIKPFHYKQKGDAPMTYEEINKLCDIIDVGGARYALGVTPAKRKGGRIGTIRHSEWELEYRIQRAEITEKGDELSISGGPIIDLELCEQLTKMFPGTEMEVGQYLDFDDDCFMWSRCFTKYLVKSGLSKEIENEYFKGFYDEEN